MATFGQWLTNRMRQRRMERPADLARATGINASLIGRWMRDEAVPGMANLARLAPALAATVEELAGRAGHLATDVPDASEPSAPHPLVRDLERMLAEESPVPQDERLLLETLIDRVIEPYRRHFRRRRAG